MEKAERRGALRCRFILALLIALGIALALGGLWGDRQYTRAGFTQENAFSVVHSLSGEVGRLYQNGILPTLTASGADAGPLEAAGVSLLSEVWQNQTRAEEALAGFSGEALRERTMKLLAATYTVSGPSIRASQRKQLAALSPEEVGRITQSLLAALSGQPGEGEAPAKAPGAEAEGAEAADLPEPAKALTAGLEGTKRSAMLLQIFLTAVNENGRYITADTVSEFKKAIRTDEARITGWIWAAEGLLNPVTRLFCSAGKTFVLLGVLMILDAVLLFFWLRADRSWRLDLRWAAILLIADFLIVFQVLPMVHMLFRALFPDGRFSLNVITRLYTNELNLGALINTLVAAGCTMVLGTALAFPLAWLVGRTNLYGRKFFRGLFILSYMVPPYVGAMAWLRLLNPNVGDLNLLLRALFGLGDGPGPLNVYSLPGLIWVLTSFYYPYAFITISRAMEKMDPTLEEASRVAGASPLKTVLKITLPMTTPALVAGALLVFISAASCYGIPSIIGVPGRVHTVTTRIIDYVGRGSDGMTDAMGLGLFLMALAILVLILSDVLAARKQYITVSGKSTRPNIVDLRKWRKPLTALVVLFALIVIVIPFATILTTSFKTDLGKSLLAPGNFTLSQWQLIFSREEVLSCLKNSCLFAAAAATVGILIACVMSYLLQRTRIRGRRLPDFLITLGSSTPSVVIALSLILSMRGNFGIDIYQTAWIIIIAYLLKYLMMGMRTVVSAMSQVHASLEESSQIAGASWGRTMLRITGPLISPSVAAGWFLIFIPSFYELSMTTLLYANGTKTIGFELYEYWTFTSQPVACAMAFAILLFVVGLNFVLNRLTKGEFSI